MIVRPNLHWFRMLFVIRGSVILDILPQLCIATLFATLVTIAHGEIFVWKVPLNFVPFSLIGLSLAIFLGFRNGTSYARFWEARTLWGTILIEARNLTRLTMTAQKRPEREDARVAVNRLIAFVHALRHQLRDTDPEADMKRLLPQDEARRVLDARFRPAVLLQMVDEWIAGHRRNDSIDGYQAMVMAGPLNRLSEALGGCERIASTPIPFTYAVILHRTIHVYCILLPFGLVDSIGPMTPVIVLFIAYTFFALEELGAELEEPFGTEQNDLALDTMSRTIEASLLELAGEKVEKPEKGAPQTVQT